MSKIKEIIRDILKKEGGYQADKEDPGNLNSEGEVVGTNYGISAPVYEKYLGRPPTKEEMKSMKLKTAEEIYEKQFVVPLSEKYGVSMDHPVFPQLVDMNVQHSPAGQAMIIQRATGAKVDGQYGPETKAKLQEALSDPYFANNLAGKRKDYYKSLIQNNPDLGKYQKGWFKRADSFRIDE